MKTDLPILRKVYLKYWLQFRKQLILIHNLTNLIFLIEILLIRLSFWQIKIKKPNSLALSSLKYWLKFEDCELSISKNVDAIGIRKSSLRGTCLIAKGKIEYISTCFSWNLRNLCKIKMIIRNLMSDSVHIMGIANSLWRYF